MPSRWTGNPGAHCRNAGPSEHNMREHNLWLTISCALTLVFGAAWAMAQERTNAPIPNSVLVGADGKYEADPDTVLVQFNISAQNETLQAASDRAKQAAEQVRDLLRKNGLDPKLAQIGQFVVSPVYDYKNPKRKLVGYRVNSSISIKFKDFSKVGPLTEDLFNLDVTDSQSVSYILQDMDAAKEKAVQDAMRRAKLLADAVAGSSAHTLGSLSYAGVDVSEPGPIIRPMMMKAMNAPAAAPPPPTEEFTPQKITVTAHVNALYNLQ
jgi:uncharacterized protein YggE